MTDNHAQIPSIRVATTIGLLVLLAATWRIWTPLDLYPRVPLLRIGLLATPLLDWVALAGLSLSLLASLFVSAKARHRPCTPVSMSRPESVGITVAIVSLAVLFITDQHRLQPWAYQMFWLLLASVGCSRNVSLRLMRSLIVSIYLFSGISKIDFQFVHSVGRELVVGLAEVAGLSATDWPASLLVVAALSLPCIEIAIAFALTFRRSRQAGAVAAILMHLALVFLLSPLGLGHKPGVALWNVFSAVLVYLVFIDGKPGPSDLPEARIRQPGKRSPRSQPVCCGLVLCVIFAPLLEPFGLWDHWLAWGLYAPSNSRVRVLVPVYAVDHLPPAVAETTRAFAVDSQWAEVPIAQLSMDRLSVPIYPQARFQVGVAMAILDEAEIQQGFRVEVLSRSKRITGTRTVKTISDRESLRRHFNRYILNAEPR